MNKITASSLNMGSEFKALLRYMFDDNEEIESDYAKHSSCRVKLLARIDQEIAIDIINEFNLPLTVDDLVGNWVIESLSDYSWGIDWDMVDEAVKVEQVTETITVTKWKPICDENVQPACSSKQPQSKVCLPQK